jgi:pyridoxal phosphate enzyme (YggS family)
MDDLSLRVQAVVEKMAEAARKAGTEPGRVELVAVSKTQSAERVREAIRAGLTCFGENKVQEAKGKIEELGRGRWRLIGHLQTNKVRDAVRLFDFIDSVDRLDLAEEIDRRADAQGKIQNVLLQVNVAGESTKFGCTPEAAAELAEAINRLPRLALHGLMTVPPFSPDPEKSRAPFAALRELRDKVETATDLRLPVLSMGMSGDFEVAIEEGSTCVRIGTALFGERLKLKQRRPEDPFFTEST